MKRSCKDMKYFVSNNPLSYEINMKANVPSVVVRMYKCVLCHSLHLPQKCLLLVNLIHRHCMELLQSSLYFFIEGMKIILFSCFSKG